MAERVLSVNVGQPTQVPYREGIISTGIFKAPVDGPVMLSPSGLEGDGQADLTVHGGAHQAAYIYSADDYAWWVTELGHPVQHGEFGENLTVTGFRDADVRVGDVIRIGGTTVQASTPREPCFKLGIRMGDHRFPARFREANRMGFYVRVLDAGPVCAGDEVELVEKAADSLTIAECHHTLVAERADRTALERLASAPGLPDDWLDWCAKRLAELA